MKIKNKKQRLGIISVALLLVLQLVMIPTPVSANTVTIVNPINNMDLRVGYTQSILVQAGTGITSVDIFVNGVNVGVAAVDNSLNTVLSGAALSTGFFRFDHTFATVGEFEIRAVGNNGAESEVTVTVRNATRTVFANETFEDFDVTDIEASESAALFRPTASALVTWPIPPTRGAHSQTYSGVDIGGRPGRSLGLIQNDPVFDSDSNLIIPGQVFGEVVYHLANPINGGRIVYEISVFPTREDRQHVILNFGNPNAAMGRWSGLWMGGPTTGGAAPNFQRIYSLFMDPGNSGTNTFFPQTFTANQWHDFRIEIDLDNHLVDMHMRVNSENPNDFEKIISQARLGPEVATMFNLNITNNTLSGGTLRFSGVNNTGTQRAYFDNLRITQYLLDPHISGVRFQPVSGATVTDPNNVPRELNAIQVQMSTAFNGMIEEDAFRLYMVVGPDRLPIPVTGSYDTITRVFTITPEFPLRYFRDYEIVFAGAASLGGVAPLEPAILEFRTQRGSVNLDNVVFTPAMVGAANVNVTATVSNTTGSAASVMLIIAAYEGEELVEIIANTVTIPGGSVQNVPLAITGISGATAVRVHMVSSLVSFANLPVSFTLE